MTRGRCLVPLLLVVCVAASTGCSSAEEGSARAEAPTALAALAADPARFRGRQVTVEGEVDERYGEGAFAIGDDRGREVVVLPEAGSADRRPSGIVRVTGRARRVGVDLQPLLRGDFAVRRTGAAIDATSIEKLGCARGPGCEQRPAG